MATRPPADRQSVDRHLAKIIATSAKTPTHYIGRFTSNIDGRTLSQCAGAEIEIYAQWVVMVVSYQLKQSIQGQRRINAALSNLPVGRLPDEKVQLGWTLEHALRNQGVHEGGYEHLALEVLVTETFPEMYAARVLHEMAVAYAGPEDITPHFDQLLNQVHSSNGLFINTEFASLVEDYIRLDPFNRALKGGSKKSRAPSPKAFSEILSILAKVTNGQEKQMTVIGGPVVAWFAAAGEWLYDLRVAIYTAGGERLHSNHGDQSSQLLLIYNSYPGIIAQAGSWALDSEQAKETAKGSPHADTASLVSTQFGGRLVYNNILVRVFGSSFRHLDKEESKTFATAIGSCARILTRIAEQEVSAGAKRSTATYGQGLLDTINNWLPELRHLQGRMERQLKLSGEDAGKLYSEQIQNLKSMCGCDICSPTDKGEDKKPGLEGYCLPSLAETVIALGLLLSCIVVASAIYPARSGIQAFYLAQAEKRRKATLQATSGHELFQLLYYDVPDTRRLQMVAQIFSGSEPTKDLRRNLVALSHEGICVYLIGKMEQDGSEDGLISVSSGGICVRQKVYTRACLGVVEVEDEVGDVWEEVKCSHLEKGLWCK
jgi:hypothetical protein